MAQRSGLARPPSSVLGPAAIGIAIGVPLALLLEVLPVLGTPVLAVLAVVALLSVARRGHPKSTALFAAMFIGAGLVFAYGFVSTVAACAGTADFCGHTPLLPVAALAVGSLVLGAASAAIGSRTSNRTPSTPQ